jgi:beta-lactamase superfamily II metal-dependent hydrolase
VTLRILPPARLDHSQNDNSVGVAVEYGRFRALLTGDAELRTLAKWGPTAGAATVVKVSHHGSGNGTTPAWVRATRPAVAIISVGGRNGYGHPAVQVEQMWRAGGARIYRTDRDGSIEIAATADGRFTISSPRTLQRRVR